jgi:hypothetical protein
MTLDTGFVDPGMSRDSNTLAGDFREYEIWPILVQKAYVAEFGWDNFIADYNARERLVRLAGGQATSVWLGNSTPANFGNIIQTAWSENRKIVFSSAAAIPGNNQNIPVTVGGQTYNIYRGHVYVVQQVALGIVTLYDPAADDGNFTLLASVQDLAQAGNRLIIL